MTTTATVTSKGQVTIPKAVRDALGLESGSELIFVQDLHDRRSVRVVPRTLTIEETFHRADTMAASSSLAPVGDDLEEAIGDAAAARAMGDKDYD